MAQRLESKPFVRPYVRHPVAAGKVENDPLSNARCVNINGAR